MERQRHLALVAGDQFQLAIVAVPQPAEKLDGVAHRGREQQRADVLRQQAERQFPDDAPLGVVEAVELVHHHGADVVKSNRPSNCNPPRSRCSSRLKQDLGHDDQHPGVGVFAAVAGDQPHVVRLEAPADGGRLHLAELLLGQGDQRRGVVGRRAGRAGPRTARPRRSASCPCRSACRPALPARRRTRPAAPPPARDTARKEADRDKDRQVRRGCGAFFSRGLA